MIKYYVKMLTLQEKTQRTQHFRFLNKTTEFTDIINFTLKKKQRLRLQKNNILSVSTIVVANMAANRADTDQLELTYHTVIILKKLISTAINCKTLKMTN